MSLASERSKSFKIRRAGPHRFRLRAEKVRARARAEEAGTKVRVKLDFQTERSSELGARVAPGQERSVSITVARIPPREIYTCKRRRRIFIRIVKLLYATLLEANLYRRNCRQIRRKTFPLQPTRAEKRCTSLLRTSTRDSRILVSKETLSKFSPDLQYICVKVETVRT